MICAEAKPSLQKWIDGELAGPPLEELEDHLETCSACSAEGTRLRENAALLRERLSSLADQVRPDLSGLSNAELETPRKEAPEHPRSRRKPRVTILVGAAILAVGLAVYFVLPPPRTAHRTTEAASRRDSEPRSAPRSRASRPLPPPSERPQTRPVAAPPSSTAGVPVAHPVPVKPGVDELLGTYISGPSLARLQQIWSSLEHDPSQAVAVTSRLGRARSNRTRAALVLCLAGANRDSVVQNILLRRLKEDGSATVRAAAAAALARSARGKGVPLRAPLGIDVPVGPIRSRDLRGRLLRIAESERNELVVRTIIQALGPSQKLDPALTKRFLELARTATGKTRRAAVKAIESGTISDPRPILDAIRDSSADASLRASLVPAMARAAGDRAGDILVNLVEDSREPKVRAAALASLPRWAPKKATPTAATILRGDDQASVKLAAVGVLARERTQAAKEELQWAAEQASDPRVRSAARDALGSRRHGGRRTRGR